MIYHTPKHFMIVFCLCCTLFGGEVYAQSRFSSVAFYNLENLFDTEDDPDIRDEEYTPKGRKEWDLEKYQKKLANMAKVISQIGDTDGPEILGVAEIENRKVLEDLVLTPALKSNKYQIIHQDSDDPRGIDVALIYKPEAFQPFEVVKLQTKDPNEPDYIFRHHLMVTGRFRGKDTLTIIVCHWPSRYGGKEEKRIAAAKRVRQAIDSLDLVRPGAKIMVMGDFNDDPSNVSIRKHLGCKAKRQQLKGNELFNPLWQLFRQGYGSLMYRGNFNLFDQILMSQSMLADEVNHGTYYPNSQRIFSEPWLFQQSGQYQGYPLRTHGGGTYLGGYSDHLPVSVAIYD